MNTQEWLRIKALLSAALDLPPADRAAWLDQACAGDAELRREVESLIASHDEAGESFLDEPPLPDVPTTGPGSPGYAPTPARIGPYRILGVLGKGGMGTVYEAVRADDAFRKQVAVKVLRRGLDSEIVLRRFRNERQILATLEHPNIARLLDGGTTADGAPFFVMECVAGKPVDVWCDEQKLSTQGRLVLFRRVCAAVHFAHQHHIIHRDIKPGNILINAEGEPKLLDFGIAKILDPELMGETLEPTQTLQRVFTPEYASPEQIRGEPVTAASDIYGLGILLYELLTGHRPFRVRSRSPHEIAYAICEEEPLRPSTAVTRIEQITTRPGTAGSTITPELVSEARGTHPGELKRTLCGDLDNIILMAMRKQPGRRYQSAAALADDITRYLEGRPVKARGDTLLYRASKHIARRKGAIAAIAATAAVAAGLAAWLARRDAPAGLARFAQAEVVPLTAFSGDESQPVFSPDGSRVAFVWRPEPNGPADIYVRPSRGGEPVQLTGSSGDDVSPAWSPDGTQIAFLRIGGERSGFYLMPAAGGPERLVSETSPLGFELVGRQIEWLPDGRSLLVVDRASPSQPFVLYEQPLDGRPRRQITSPPRTGVGDVSPALAPDGRSLAFVRIVTSGVGQVYTQDVGGGPATQRTFDNGWISAVAWSADGSELVFSSFRTGNPALWRIPARGSQGEPQRVPGIAGNVTDPAFSRDGTRLAYTQMASDSNIWAIDLPSGAAQPFLTSTQIDQSPWYSPDGSAIVFRSSRGGTNEIWIAGADGSRPRQMTRFGGPLTGTPRWSPDGRWIAFDSRPKGQAHIFLLPPEGGTPRQFTSGSAENVVPSFSADSRWVYFGSNRSGAWEVWKQPVAGGGAQQVTRQGGFAALESPDGRYVYFTRARNELGLWRVPAAGGSEQTIIPGLKAGYWGYFFVSRRGVYYIDRESPNKPGFVYLLDPETQVQRVLARIERSVTVGTSGFAVSPDERRILYTQQDQSTSDIMLAEVPAR